MYRLLALLAHSRLLAIEFMLFKLFIVIFIYMFIPIFIYLFWLQQNEIWRGRQLFSVCIKVLCWYCHFKLFTKSWNLDLSWFTRCAYTEYMRKIVNMHRVVCPWWGQLWQHIYKIIIMNFCSWCSSWIHTIQTKHKTMHFFPILYHEKYF